MVSGALTCTKMQIVLGSRSTWSQEPRDARDARLGGRASRCQFLMLGMLVSSRGHSAWTVAWVKGKIWRKLFEVQAYPVTG